MVRAALPGDLPAIARLRWQWWDEWRTDGTPDEDPAAFSAEFTAWAERSTATHRASVVVDGEEVVGMAWLAEVSRPPSPGHLDIRRGDLQSVYVVPELRGQGWGARLVAHVLEDARARGMQRVTVYSGGRSLSLYARAGFEVTEHLRQVDL
nr:GNAT family N-acetyltransferase [Quadrisphaera sp. RL12-1S]